MIRCLEGADLLFQEVSALQKIKRGVRLGLLLLVFGVIATGCLPGRGTVGTGWTVLTVSEDRVYAILATGDAVVLDSQDGGLIWRHPTEAAAPGAGCGIARPAATENEAEGPLGAVYGQPVLTDDLVLFGSYDGRLYALDRETGTRMWTFAVAEAIIGGIAEADGVLYFGSADSRIYALDLETRQLVWNQPFQTGDRVWGTPVIGGATIYIGSMDHRVYALDRATGQELWSAELGGAIPGDIAVSNGRVFAGGIDRRLHVFDADTGERLWRTERLGGWLWGEPLVVEDAVYVTSLDGQLYGFEVQTGDALWEPFVMQGAVRTGAALWDGQLIVGTDEGRVYLVDRLTGTGEAFYGTVAAEQRGGILAPITTADEKFYVGSTLGSVAALDPELRFPEVWVYPSPDEN